MSGDGAAVVAASRLTAAIDRMRAVRDGGLLPVGSLQRPVYDFLDEWDRLHAAGWQLTRVGDEERLRAVQLAARDVVNVVQFDLDGREIRTPRVVIGDGGEWAAAIRRLRDALAPQPPSPASQGEER